MTWIPCHICLVNGVMEEFLYFLSMSMHCNFYDTVHVGSICSKGTSTAETLFSEIPQKEPPVTKTACVILSLLNRECVYIVRV